METKAKKRILFYVGATKVFGAEIVMLDVMKGLKSDFDIHCVINGWNDGDFKSRLEKAGINYTEVKLGWYYITKLLWSLASFINLPGAFIKTRNLIKNFKPNIIYVISYRTLVIIYPLIKSKVIYHVHDANHGNRQHEYFLHLVDKKVTRYIAVSKFIKNDLMLCGINENKISVVHNGVEIPDEKDLKKTESDVLRIGIVGQIIPRKGHQILIESLNLLKEAGYEFELNVYGVGDVVNIEKIKNYINSKELSGLVNWKGYEQNKELIFKNLDIVVCSSILPEPFGMSALEPSAYKIPVIASNIGGYKEIIKDGINGYIFENGNSFDLGDKIKYFLDDRSKLSEIGSKAYDYVIKNFSAEDQIKKIKKIINEII